MEIKSLVKDYHNYFENKVDHADHTLPKIGWRFLQITTGILCYPILGLVSGVALAVDKLASLNFQKTKSQDPTPITDRKITISKPEEQIGELKKKFEDLKLIPLNTLNEEKLNDQLESLNRLEKELTSFDPSKETPELPVDNEPELPIDNNLGGMIQAAKNQLTIDKVRKQLDEEVKTIIHQVKDQIHQVEDQIEFIEEVKGAGQKGLIDLKNSEEEINGLRNNKELMALYQKIQKFRREKEVESVRQDPKHRLERTVAKATFAFQIGVKPQYPSTGVHATFFMLSTKGKKLGVFKKADLRVGPVRQIFRFLGEKVGIGQEMILNKGHYAQIAGEKAAYIIKQKMEAATGGQKFGFDLAPVKITSFTNFSEKNDDNSKGAFLVFCKNVKLADEVLSSINKSTPFQKEEIIRCHSAFLYDFLLGNLDRHTKNYMIGTTEEGKVDKVLLIDNSNILPIEEPKIHNIVATKARFVWRNLSISKEQVPKEVKDMFLKILEDSDQFIEDIFEGEDGINKDPEIVELFEIDKQENPQILGKDDVKYFSEQSKDTMKARARFLKQALLSKENSSLEEMINQFLG